MCYGMFTNNNLLEMTKPTIEDGFYIFDPELNSSQFTFNGLIPFTDGCSPSNGGLYEDENCQ